VQIARSRGSLIAVVGIAVAIVVGVTWYVRRAPPGEVNSVAEANANRVASPTNITARDSTGGAPAAPESVGANVGSAEYPVKLDALRAKFPNNRYWSDGAPTSDPMLAHMRAAKAERDNAALGKIQANEATPEEIRAYYDDRRALSRDYLQISQAVLDEQGDKLPERDRGMFQLSVNMHRDRLKQIDRDESDALARRAAAPGAGGKPAGSTGAAGASGGASAAGSNAAQNADPQ